MVWTFPSKLKFKPFVMLHLDHVTYLEKVSGVFSSKPLRFRMLQACAFVRTLAADRACPTSSKFRAMNSEFSSFVRFVSEAPKRSWRSFIIRKTRMDPKH
ncbi:hypothetical protein BASA81_011369 [Batrachochytrium salamandrivorans]|nr:hypothetical protein BASA81_011369 [Batrachochytrium salamandrivorans]